MTPVGPLHDIVVIDLSRALAGPHTGMMLGDMGARVIKVESPGTGDDTRGWGPPFVGPEDDPISTYFLSCNRNKESITLDLKSEDGPMSLTGPDPEHPTRVGVPIADLLAAMYGACGVVAALHERNTTGVGRVVRTSLLAAIVGVHAFQGTRYTVAGEVPQPQGNHHPSIVPYGLFSCADGTLQIAIGSDGLWQRFALADLLPRLEASGIPAGGVRTLDRVYEWEQTRSQGLVIEVDHPVLGRIELPGPPLRFDDLPYAGGRCEHLPPPGLGAHNESVRDWLDERDRVDAIHDGGESTNEATGDQE